MNVLNTILEEQPRKQEQVRYASYKGEYAAIGGIGIIHGLASNDELLLLLTLSLGITSFFGIFIGLTIFTMGVVIGMMLFSLLIKLPISELGRERLIKTINVTIAIITLIYGIYSIAGGETINILPIHGNIHAPLLVVALILGIKHSMDADHLVAISGLLLRAKNLSQSIRLSITWALGHMVTASIITFILYSFRELFLSKILTHFELLVGIMLVTIALFTLAWEFDIINWGKHSHSHSHQHTHPHDHSHHLTTMSD